MAILLHNSILGIDMLDLGVGKPLVLMHSIVGYSLDMSPILVVCNKCDSNATQFKSLLIIGKWARIHVKEVDRGGQHISWIEWDAASMAMGGTLYVTSFFSLGKGVAWMGFLAFFIKIILHWSCLWINTNLRHEFWKAHSFVLAIGLSSLSESPLNVRWCLPLSRVWETTPWLSFLCFGARRESER